MRFGEWIRWFKQLPWSRKWFVILILIRPAVDGLYFLKDISPLLSPLYMIGVLTPVIITAGFFAQAYPRIGIVRHDVLFGLLGLIVGVNCIFILGIEVSIGTAEIVSKLTLPFFLYFFLRRCVRTGDDLLGIVMAFVYSASIPISIAIFETIVAPVNHHDVARGMERVHGIYADVVSYAVYSTQAFLCLSYLFLLQGRSQFAGTLVRATRDLIIGFSMCLVCLFAIKHAASWAVAGALLLLLAFHSFSQLRLPLVIGLLTMIVVSFFYLGDRIREDTVSIYQTDLAIVRGNERLERGLHGRVTTWKKMLGDWYEFPIFSKMLGGPLSLRKEARTMLLGAAHNDYLRFTFVAGLAGLAIYLLFLVNQLLSSFKAPTAEQFLIRGTVVLIGLYSITILPTLYAPCIYLAMTVFAYAALIEEASSSNKWASLRPSHQ